MTQVVLHSPRRALAAALLLLTLTQLAFADPGPTPARLDELERHAGQNILVQGIAHPDGARFLLEWDGHGVMVVPPGAARDAPTGPVEVEGTLARNGHELVLYADAVRPWTA